MKTITERLLALPSCEDPDEILNAAITGAHEIQRLTAREYLRRKADQRAIEAWHKAHPEKAHMPPSNEDVVMWLMEQHDQFETRLKNAHHDWLAELNHDTDQLMEEARLGGLEEGALEIDCGCDIRAAVLERLKSQGERQAERLCPKGDGCCALQSAAIRALSDTPPSMVLVPREPTSAMIQAGGYALQEHAAMTMDAARIAWGAMVKAAGKGEGDE